MNIDEQNRIREALAATLQDHRLSRGETNALEQMIDDWQSEDDALGYIRNTAYRLAEDEVAGHPEATLNWLRRVDRIVDGAQRAGRPVEAVNTVAFSPGDEARLLITQQLQSARKSIDVCVFTITDDRITRALLEADRRGVAVRIVSDDDKRDDTGSDVYSLASKGIRVRVDPNRNHMHHKFAIIDERIVITGSYNWTRGATRNLENVLVTTEPDIVISYKREFDRLWQLFA